MIYRFTKDNNDLHQGGMHPSLRSDVEQHNTPLQTHDPDSVDIQFANKLAQELINISGANVIIYPRKDNSSYDHVWGEDHNPSYGKGKPIKGFFAPEPISTQLTQWGVDTPNKTTIRFSRINIIKEFGKRMVRQGDVMDIPYNSAIRKLGRYRILNVTDAGNFKYTWLYIECIIENIPDDKVLDIEHN